MFQELLIYLPLAHYGREPECFSGTLVILCPLSLLKWAELSTGCL